MKELYSSLYKDRLGLRMDGRGIVITDLPHLSAGQEIQVRILAPARSLYVFEDMLPCRLPAYLDPGPLPDGEYRLHLYETVASGRRLDLTLAGGIPLKARSGELHLIHPAPFERNRDLFLTLSEDFVRKYRSALVPCSEYIPKQVVSTAHGIVRHCFSHYDKILAVHDWVAENIHFDLDSIQSGSWLHARTDALSILETRRTVCEGYSSLATALLRAVGVRAVNIDCFALGVSTNGDWSQPGNMTEPANHVVTFAYADRWIMMDTTWDSPKIFRDGRFQTSPGRSLSRKYFDATLAFFSYTHRFLCPEGVV